VIRFASAFSRAPVQITSEWRIAFRARLKILLLGMLILLFSFPGNINLAIIVWLFGLFVAQCCDTLVVYTKRLGLAALFEASGLAVVVFGVLAFQTQLTLEWVIWLFTLAALLRATLLACSFRQWIVPGGVTLPEQRAFLVDAMPFFILGLTGMLQSRADLYVAGLLIPPSELARYQILTSIIGYAQALPNIVLLPFIRVLYRIEATKLPHLARSLVLGGLLVVPIFVIGITALVNILYAFNYSTETVATMFAAAIPIYWYLPQIYALYRVGKERIVVMVNIAGAVASCILSLAFIPVYGIAGGILAAALAQWLMLGLYLYTTTHIADNGHGNQPIG
jgi:O-antigen/teichoic acid export membrane protein